MYLIQKEDPDDKSRPLGQQQRVRIVIVKIR